MRPKLATACDRTWLLTYDEMDRITSIAAPPTSPGGAPRQTTFEYNVVGDVVTVRHPDGGVDRYKYDERYQLIEADWASGVTARYAYDDRGDLNHASVTQPDGSVGGMVDYTFDGLRRPRTVAYADGSSIAYGYDEQGGCQAYRVS